jgi:hypothetical protein
MNKGVMATSLLRRIYAFVHLVGKRGKTSGFDGPANGCRNDRPAGSRRHDVEGGRY